MNEEEKSNLYIYTYSDLDDDFVFAETKYTLGDLHKLQQELQKYKSLYENEKDHTYTLKRIIKEVKENLERHLTAKSYGNHKYELFGREYLEEILDLLKEIK